MFKRLLFLAALVPSVAQAECYWINGQYACTLGNTYNVPVQPYVPPQNYYYAPPPMYVPPPPPITPGYIAPPPADWGYTRIVPRSNSNGLGDQ